MELRHIRHFMLGEEALVILGHELAATVFPF
jgi:hypothetical protein